ncbi:replication-relaxation family protein [Bacillus pseudomycoides]|uniref:replication-relaxation family protein n=1 Tax=Bacillus pseudomycoides TaxID=64104 RepID=UPI000BEC8899|nr:replication-relaxation family protein [Bacillus pseudomycoides]PEB42258.1 hypothetical protein COO06_08075 [Bacillus pseudomycoides]
MNKRDKYIIDDLYRFRVLTRDQIISLHFSDLKKPIGNCNLVLKRLSDRGYIKALRNYKPYVYIPSDSKIKENSQKILHFLAIADVYVEMKQYDTPTNLIVEPKFTEKGAIEPDMFCCWKKSAFFVEVQRTTYSEKVMNEKISRYEAFYYSEIWENFEWQRSDKKVFPIIIFVTNTRYNIKTDVLKIVQVPSIHTLIELFDHNSVRQKIKKTTVSNQKSSDKIKIQINNKTSLI